MACLAAAVSVTLAGCSAKPTNPAGATAAADSGAANPLIGNWTLVAADNDNVCPDNIQFTADTYTTVWKGATETKHAAYHAYPGYMNVFLDADISHYLQFNLTSADVITNVTGNQYAMNNCPYGKS